GINQPFLYKISNTVIEENKSAYPELEQKADYIKKVIKIEEERFEKTIGQGIELLTELIDKIDSKNLSGDKILNGADAFKLYDTFGFPIDLTKEIIAERNICLDEEKFISLMNEQKTRARASSKKDSAFVGENSIIDTKLFNATAFCGYDSIQSQGKIITMADENEEKASANEGENIFIILDKTPFYAQSGGQISDTGIIETENAKITVIDVEKTQNGVYIHSCFVESGSVFNGDIVQSKVNEDKRTAVMRNHTAAHLLQKALNNVLGSHVHQAGQLVDEHRVRFDFNHFSAVNSEELKEIELTINKKILACLPVVCKEMPIEEAKLLGATALFGEKYGDMVRVVDIGGYSMEFCGGTHAHNTGSLGLFKIISESSVAAGVRRIEGVTGFGVLNIINDTNKIILDSAAQLKLSNPSELAIKVASLCADVKTYEKEINKLEEEIADVKFGDVFGKANDICGFKLLVATFTGMKSDALRKIGDKAREKNTKAIAIISTINEGKSTVLCVCGKEALEAGVDANKIVKAITAVTGGGGGGKPDCAMAGIKDQFKLDEA
ncbi:MAG: alanine--tRNA ligase, partial [Oscillospiraceae bacterium]